MKEIFSSLLRARARPGSWGLQEIQDCISDSGGGISAAKREGKTLLCRNEQIVSLLCSGRFDQRTRV
ncbi:MAG: hypothetical protein C4576_26580 [Desulfobacteraceae bacterium]|nr:MAG: hypothetical protein C4576_26580 [Desulfobacteraceae bacterium]